MNAKRSSHLDTVSHLNIRKSFLIFLTLFLVLLLMVPVCSATTIQKFSVDSKSYTPGGTINVAGMIQDGNASGEVRISIWSLGEEFTELENQSVNKTVSAVDGVFSTSINAPSTPEDYSIVAVDVESGVQSPVLEIFVVGVSDSDWVRMFFTEGEVFNVALSSSSGITGPLASDKTGGTINVGGTDYYFLVSGNNVVYMDDDSDMDPASDSSGMSVISNLIEGSKVKLDGVTYRIVHVNNDAQIVLTKTLAPNFNGGESVNLTMLALNYSDSPVANMVELECFKYDGTEVFISEIYTENNGLNTSTITIGDDAGLFHLIADDIGHMSFTVKTMDLYGDILSTENDPKHTFACGEDMVPVVYLKNINTGAPISTATVTSTITSRSDDTYSNELTLTYDSEIGAYTASYTIPLNTNIDTYFVEYVATSDGDIQKAYTNYNIKAYDLFMKAISKNKGDSEGFAAGDEGFLMLAGTNLSNGESIDLEAATQFNKSLFSLSITNSSGSNINTTWSLMNLSTFYTYMNVPQDVRQEISQMFGDSLTVINFTAPTEYGVYDVVLEVKVDEWASLRDTIVVQDLFIHGEPVNKLGWFAPTVAPNSTARLLIVAFDPATGSEIPASQIHEAGLVEVWSESNNDIVTEYMEDPVLETISMPFMGDQKVLKFNVTDSNLGFHHVKFWVNATVDGSPKTVIGDGWFDEKLYSVKAKPVFDSQSNMFKVFGSSDNIALSVHVEDVSGNNVSDASIEIESVKYSMTGEVISLEDSSTAYTTNDNGKVTVEFDPSSNLRSGFYNVRVKMTTQDGNIDYGRGWFEVSNFIFSPYSTSWDAGIDQPINFTLNAFTSNFTGKQVDVTLTKIISMGDWDMMTPPTVYATPDIDVGIINGTGYYEYPGLPVGGNFEFVFEATDGSSIEVGRAWVHTTAFVAWVDAGWQYEFPTNGFMNFTVKAADDCMWGSAGHNITGVTIEKVMQEGMWMNTYKNSAQMSPITSVQSGENENELLVSVNTSGWGQGNYMMKMKVNDGESEVYTDFWFQLKLASVTVTNPMQLIVNSGVFVTNASSINATNDLLAKQDRFRSIGNITAGKVGGLPADEEPRTPIKTSWDIIGDDPWNNPAVPYYSIVAVDTVQNTVYIEYMNVSAGDERWHTEANLSDTSATHVFNASVGESFTDMSGRNWTITCISSEGTINLESQNSLNNGIKLNESIMSMSKSGKFLVTTFHDEEWQQIDLDGDSEYHEDSYIVLLVDSVTAGKYGKVLVSDSYDFSARYIDASAGDPVTFGGNAIYLISNNFQSNAYNLEFSTYNKGWMGMNLGTYQNGSVINIPFLVQTPSGEPLANKNVVIDFLIDESKQIEVLDGVNATTDSAGLALVKINTSEQIIPTGKWMIHYNVSIGSEYAVANEEMFWELTRFEVRNFVVTGALGTSGEIDLVKLYDDDPSDGMPGNDMLLSYGEEIELRRGISAHHMGHEDRFRIGWPFENWFYNSTSGDIMYSTDNGNTGVVSGDNVINSSNLRYQIDYEVVSITPGNTNVTLTRGVPKEFFDGMWNFTYTDYDEANSTATIAMTYMGWSWTIPGYHDHSSPMVQKMGVDDGSWMGGLDFEVEFIDSNNVVISTRNTLFVLSSVDAAALMDNSDANGEMDVYPAAVTSVRFNGNDYYLFGFESTTGSMHDMFENSYEETKDSVMVINISSDSEPASIYRIGEPISELNNYHVASVSMWGAKFILLNNSVTSIYPIPQWSSDAPVFYAGTFSDADVNMDVATAGNDHFDEEKTPGVGNISSDDRYHMLLMDRLPNGVDHPTEAIYDDDPDLTDLRDWENWMDTSTISDLYGLEAGYGDAIPDGMGGSELISLVNMSEKRAWNIGTGNMDEWPIAFPSIVIDEDSDTAKLKSFIPEFDVDVTENITIFITAREFDGTPLDGVATLSSMKMMFGGNFDTGPIGDVPVAWNLESKMINTTLVNGEGTLVITPADLSEVDYDFGEYAAVVTIEKGTGEVETLKMNFFRFNEDEMPDFDDKEGGPEGDHHKDY